MTTYYIVDIDTNTIVNAVEANTTEQAQGAVARMIDPHKLRVSTHPPMSMLKRYRYWDERP